MWIETCMKSLQVDQGLPSQGEAFSPLVWEFPLVNPQGQSLPKGYLAASHRNCKKWIHTHTRHHGLCGNARGPGAAGNKEPWDPCVNSMKMAAQVELVVSTEEKRHVH
jgi:hypothetical protein